MAKKKKFYVVWQGNDPGIYDTWAACLQQVKGFPAAKYKSFPTRDQAEDAFANSYDDYISKGTESKKSVITEEARAAIDFDTICVDAACSGNPGPMEYRGVETESQLQLFIQKFPIGTNNIGEFLAIVHGLAHLQRENNLKMPIYSDSKHAIKWVHNKKCNTKLVRNAKTKSIHDIIARAETWLHNNKFENPLLKWETKKWGEIPADFGRK
jgi:ribonuclease HI